MIPPPYNEVYPLDIIPSFHIRRELYGIDCLFQHTIILTLLIMRTGNAEAPAEAAFSPDTLPDPV